MRRERKVAITAEGRDKGKLFVISEMPADAGERWANRMILALLNANVKVAPEARDGGTAGLFAVMPTTSLAGSIKWLAGMAYDSALEALLDEQMRCVKYQPPGGFPAQDLADGLASQVEEISTRWHLRTEWLELHLGFLLAADALTTDTAPPASSPA